MPFVTISIWISIHLKVINLAYLICTAISEGIIKIRIHAAKYPQLFYRYLPYISMVEHSSITLLHILDKRIPITPLDSLLFYNHAYNTTRLLLDGCVMIGLNKCLSNSSHNCLVLRFILVLWYWFKPIVL